MKILNKKLFYILAAFIVIGTGVYVYYKITNNQPYTSPPITNSTNTPNNNTGTKTYRNTEFGFEFEYPKDWTLEENSFYSPFSKFNLIGASPKEKGIGNPVIPSFLVNIVTLSFADTFVRNTKISEATTSDVVIAGIKAKKYEYEFESVSRITIDVPLEEYHVLLGTGKSYENVFNQILASFKFLR